jgi:hypothetical protein
MEKDGARRNYIPYVVTSLQNWNTNRLPPPLLQQPFQILIDCSRLISSGRFERITDKELRSFSVKNDLSESRNALYLGCWRLG